MTAFDAAWSVLKAPLDLDSIQELNNVDSPSYRANHYDSEGNRFRMLAQVFGGGGADVKAYAAGPNPITETGERVVGSLNINDSTHEHAGEAELLIAERMVLAHNPFDEGIFAEQNPHLFTDRELDAIQSNYEEALEMLRDYSPGSKIDVQQDFQRRGIATAMRDFPSELNDNYLPDDLQVDLRPDPAQTFSAHRLWAANQNDLNYDDRLHEIRWRGLRERMGDAQ